ncbi:MAG TPA: glycerophosphoryl diester phosphodiesterase membrane domain-containing protein [Steroidobacteraceae bacterium]
MSTHLYPPQRPQSIPEVLDGIFKIFSTSLLKVLPYSMLLTLVGQLGKIYALATGAPIRRFPFRDPTWWFLFVLSTTLSCVLWVALLLRQRAIAQGLPVSARAEFAAAFGKLPALLLLVTLTILATGLGAILLVVPGVYLFVALSMALPEFLFEQRPPLEAMQSSLRLVRGNWWRVFAVMLVCTVIVLVFNILGGIFAFILVQFERGADLAVVTATSTVFIISLGVVVMPFMVAMTLALFGDLLARRALAAAGP